VPNLGVNSIGVFMQRLYNQMVPNVGRTPHKGIHQGPVWF